MFVLRLTCNGFLVSCHLSSHVTTLVFNNCREWSMSCGSGDYLDLMENYPQVSSVFHRLEKKYQQVVEDICRRMGNGMADFIVKEVVSIQDYDLYCHYVAGLVGIGLSQLFASSGLEDKSFADAEALANNMGLFLQKTNIIRDYLEDINEEPAPRMFWPKEIWGKYGKTLADFKSGEHAIEAVQCLNHMVRASIIHFMLWCSMMLYCVALKLCT